MMKLYYAEVLNPRKACAAARYLGSPVEFVRVDLAKGEQRSAEYVAINPNARVPALLDGDHAIWESNAIMVYLAMKAGSDFWPRDERQIDVTRWLSWDLSHFSVYGGTLYFEHLIKAAFDIGPPDPAAVAEATAEFRRSAAVLNDHLDGRDYLVGESLTLADFAVAAALPYAKGAKIPLDEFPAVARWHDRLNTLDAWRAPFPAALAQA